MSQDLDPQVRMQIMATFTHENTQLPPGQLVQADAICLAHQNCSAKILDHCPEGPAQDSAIASLRQSMYLSLASCLQAFPPPPE